MAVNSDMGILHHNFVSADVKHITLEFEKRPKIPQQHPHVSMNADFTIDESVN